MEELLESVADAVSALVMYSVEADELDTAIPDIVPGATGVKAATDYLCDLAEQQAQNWKTIKQENMFHKMVGACKDIREDTSGIVKAAHALRANAFDRDGKKLLLKSAKAVMQHMVVLLQLADLYDVTRIVKMATRVKDQINNVVSGGAGGEQFFKVAAQEAVSGTGDLTRAVYKRLTNIDDYDIKTRLEKNTEVVKTDINDLLQAMVNALRGDNGAKNQANQVAATLSRAIDEIIKAVKDSAKSPFDLSQLEGLDLRDYDDLLDIHQGILGELANIRDAVKRGDGDALEKALAAIRNGLMDELAINKQLLNKIEDPELRKRLADAIAAAERALGDLMKRMGDAARDALKNPRPEFLDRLNKALDEVEAMSADLVNAAAPPSPEDVWKKHLELEKAFDDLLNAVKAGDQADADKALNSIRKGLQDEIDLAKRIAKGIEDPELRQKLLDAIAAAERALGDLMNRMGDAARKAIRNPGDRDALDKLNKAIEDARAMSKGLVDATSTGTPEDIYQLGKQLDNAYNDLLNAIKAGDEKGTTKALRDMRKGLNDQLNIAKQLARKTDDPELRKKLEDAINAAQRALDRLLGEMGKLAKDALKNPNNKDLLDKLDQTFAGLKGLSDQMVAAAAPELLKESGERLNARVNELQQAVQQRDSPRAVAALKEISKEVDRQRDLGDAVSRFLPEDPERAKRLADKVAEIKPHPADLANKVKAALSNPNDERAQKDFKDQAANTKTTSAQLVNAAVLPTEDELLENANVIEGKLKKAGDQEHANDIPATAQTVADALRDMQNQIKVANNFANRTRDARRRGDILKASQDLSKAINDLLKAMADVAADPNNEGKRKALRDALARARQANMAVVAATTDDPAEEMQRQHALALEAMNELLDALARGDIEGIARALKKLNDAIAKEIMMAKAIASKTDDPEKKKNIYDRIADVEALQSQILPAIKDARANPNDPRKQQRLYDLFDDTRKALDALIASTMTSPRERLLENAVRVGDEFAQLEATTHKGDKAGSDKAMGEVRSVAQQQVALANAAAAEEKDPAKREAYHAAAKKLENSLAPLASAAKASAANPGDRQARQAFDAALKEAREAFADTAALTVADPEEAIQDLANKIKRDVERQGNAVARGSPAEAAHAADQLRGPIRAEVELAKAYAKQLDDPEVKKATMNALGDLDRVYDNLAQAAERVADGQASAKGDVAKNLPPTKDALDRVIAATRRTPEEELRAQAVKANVAFGNLDSSLADRRGNEDAVKDLGRALAKEAAAARQIANAARGNQRNEIVDATSALERLTPQVVSAARAVSENPNDSGAKRHYDDLKNEVKAAQEKLVAAASTSPAQAIVDIAVKVGGEVDDVGNKLRTGNKAEAAKALKTLTTNGAEEVKLAAAIADKLDNPEAKSKVKAALADYNRLAPQLEAAGRRALDNPSAAGDYDRVAAQAKEALGRAIDAAIGNPEDRIIQNGPVVDNEASNLASAARAGDLNALEAALGVEAQKLSEQGALAKVMADQMQREGGADASKASAVRRDAEALDRLNTQLASVASKALAGDKRAAGEIAALTSQIQDANRNIVDAARARKNAKDEAKRRAEEERRRLEEERRRAEEERRRREEEERRRQEQAKKDEAESAAAALAARLAALEDNDKTSFGRLFGLSKRIAEEMARLAAAAKTNDKRGMIEAARRIAALAVDIVKEAHASAAQCRDPALKNQIILPAQAAKNLSVQLKIIASVKAATDDDDPAAKAQLVTCCKTIATDLIKCCDATEVGAIRGGFMVSS